ncbi:hypothetical protein C8Q75DRAFT_810189 [Abortiporus biennis]|nr:hypothetical protein C8Q75DRAFT_810189 [Abortiporus biennis]
MPRNASINPTSCTLHVVEDADCEGAPVLKQLKFEAKHKRRGKGQSPEVVASADAVLVQRTLLGAQNFLTVLDEHSNDLQKFGLKFFNKNGKFRRDVYVDVEDEDEYHRGTGCWGNSGEFDAPNAKIIFIRSLDVEESQFENQGIEEWLLKQILSSHYVGRHDFVFIQTEPSSEEETLFKVNGFRRVGQTQYFAFSPNPNHPSRTIPISEDAKGASQFAVGPPPDAMSPEESAIRFPLHSAIANYRSTEGPITSAVGGSEEFDILVTVTQSLNPMLQAQANVQNPRKPISDVLKEAFTKDPDSLKVRDIDNRTVLHLAAEKNNVEALRTLLSPPLLSVTQDMLGIRDCAHGYTALNDCEFGMNDMKTFSESLLGRWDGHADDALKCAYLLRKAMGRANVRDIETEDEYIKKNKFGCTCGECAFGWLSPRMRLNIKTQNDMVHANLVTSRQATTVRGGRLYSQDEIDINTAGVFDYVPAQSRRRVTNHLVDTIILVLVMIRRVLEFKELIPIPYCINSALPIEIKVILDNHGVKIEHLLEIIMETVTDQAPIEYGGDGEYEEMLAYGVDLKKEFENLPECVNDNEYKLARMCMGLSPTSQREIEPGVYVYDSSESE